MKFSIFGLNARLLLGWGLLMLIGAGACRQDQAYLQLIAQISRDPVIAAVNRPSQSTLSVIRPSALDSVLRRNAHYQTALRELDLKRLNEGQRANLDSLHRRLAVMETSWREYRHDPSLYNFGGEVKKILIRQDISLEERLEIIGQGLALAAPYYESAKANLRAPKPERSRLAAQKQILGLRLLSNELPDSIRYSSLAPAVKRRLADETGRVLILVKDYLAFCESLWFEHLDSLRQTTVETTDL